MKRLLLALAAALPALAEKTEAAAESGASEIWAWLNFALLAGALAWLFRKNAVPYLVARAREIRQAMADAGVSQADARRRLDAVEARLAGLAADIQTMRADAEAARHVESERVRAATQADLEKIRRHAEQEIASAARTARFELKRYSASLALQLAEQKIQARLTPAGQDALYRGFVHNLAASRQEFL